MNLPKPTPIEPLVKTALLRLGRLAGTVLQPWMTNEDVPKVAQRHAQIMAFWGQTPEDVPEDLLEYQAYVDGLLWQTENAPEIAIIEFLKFAGKPLTPEQFTAWFFGKL